MKTSYTLNSCSSKTSIDATEDFQDLHSQYFRNLLLLLLLFCLSRILSVSLLCDQTGCTDHTQTSQSPMNQIKQDTRVGVKQRRLSVEEWREWHLCAHCFLLLCSPSCIQCLVYSCSLTAAQTKHQASGWSFSSTFHCNDFYVVEFVMFF